MKRYDVLRITPDGPRYSSSHATRSAAADRIRRSEECYRDRGRPVPTYTIAEYDDVRMTINIETIETTHAAL